MSRKAPSTFSRSTMERVIAVLTDAPITGLTVLDVAVATQLAHTSARRLCGRFGALVPQFGSRRAGKVDRYVLRPDAAEQLARHAPAEGAARPPVPIPGMCRDCTCKLVPTDFGTKDGRVVLLQCQRPATTTAAIVSVADDVFRHPSRGLPRGASPAAELQRTVLRTLKAHETPMTMDDLVRVIGIGSLGLSAAMTSLLARGAIVKLLRTRPGRAGIAVFAMPGAVPDPLRAS